MKHRFTALSLLAALTVAACMAGAAFAQDEVKDTIPAKPMYAHLKPNIRTDIISPATPLTTWNGTFVHSGTTYKYNMVGTTPSTGTSTTIPVFIIPLKLVYKTSTSTTSFSALHKLSNGRTVVQNVLDSPIFSSMDFKTKGGVDLGTTQYEDAFQRGNFWGQVSKATGYHVLL